ncbi:PaaI family thioesterase [Pontibrevibacter nitratireducens]|uniref:PaaI family thioesterase n=2 Tax=Pontivivens nitratireducens TaxID=2758038 RepID=A0A6G7VP59_9RHOB|nr:PaaI family thioesterase [Pontibrevibacter nitratireducens]
MSLGESDAPPEGFILFSRRGNAESVLGPYYWRIQDGHRAMGFRVKSHHLNRNGVCHGGVISAFADAQSAILKIGTEVDCFVTPTINLTVDYIAPAREKNWIESAPVLVKKTNKLLFVAANISVDGGIIARMNGIYKITSTLVPEVSE